MSRDASDAAIVECVIDLAANLGMKALAEGVETRGTVAMLESYGCDHVQGFHVGAPMSGEQFLAWLREGGWSVRALGEAQAPAR
jgi:EAL domain-containing protein (putative c-di-GMP-specific phosphodiesterase class I)